MQCEHQHEQELDILVFQTNYCRSMRLSILDSFRNGIMETPILADTWVYPKDSICLSAFIMKSSACLPLSNNLTSVNGM